MPFAVTKEMISPIATDAHTHAVSKILNRMGYDAHPVDEFSFIINSDAISSTTPSATDWELAVSKCRHNDWLPLVRSGTRETYVANGHLADIVRDYEESYEDTARFNIQESTITVLVDEEEVSCISLPGYLDEATSDVSYREAVTALLQEVAQGFPAPWAYSLRPFIVNLAMLGDKATEALGRSMVALLKVLNYDAIFDDTFPDPNQPSPAEGIPDTPSDDDWQLCLCKLHHNDFLPLTDTRDSEVYAINGHVVKVELDLSLQPSSPQIPGMNTLVYDVTVDDQSYDRIEVDYAADMAESEIDFSLRYQKAVTTHLEELAQKLPSLWL